MLFFRHVGALLRRNFIYRKRRPISSIAELILPAVAVWILVAIKESLKDSKGFTPVLQPAVYPDSNNALIPLSFKDYLTAFQATKQCVPNPYTVANSTKKRPSGVDTETFGKIKNIDYFISGIDVADWAVPFVKCDSRKCSTLGQNATEFCTYHVLALAPSSSDDTRVKSFENYIRSTFPQIAMIKNQTGFDVIKLFTSSSDIDRYVTSSDYGKTGFPKISVAVVLDGSGKEFSYTIRTNSTNFNSKELFGRPVTPSQPSTSILFDTFAKRAQDACDFTDDGGPFLGPYQKYCNAQYMYNGALPIQRLVDDWIFHETGADGKGAFIAENGVRFINFPSKEYWTNGFYAQIAAYAPLLVAIGFLFPFASCVRSLVGEKEMRLKELLKIMSISEAAIGWSWWISFFIFFTVSAVLTTIASAFMYPHTSFILLFIFWELAFVAIFMFSFFVASLFNNTFRATIAAVLLCLVGYFLTLVSNYATGNMSTILGVSIHPVTAMCYGLQVLGSLEEKQVGLVKQLLNFTDSSSKFTFAMALGMLFFDIFFYAVLSFYFIRVIQGSYGRRYTWYFLFSRSYWCPGWTRHHGTVDTADDNSEIIPKEAVPVALKEQEKDGKAVVIRGLTKRFGNKTAVDRLDLEMYTGQIFALLGENGAGKTTTINILTGMMPADSGFVTVLGKDANTEMSSIRDNIGICLQHDCLFPLLTVDEHVRFFARVKGLFERRSIAEANNSIRESIDNVGLLDKLNTLSTNLSGGMKRKLSVAIAFCGESKVIFLDEPTSGMDPFSRRFTWNVIRQYRQDRCIILTTHFMDEADLLGDRIAILQTGGKLRCVGSSLFLKKEFGVGYQLTIAKAPKLSTDVASDEVVKDIVLGNSLGAKLLTNVGAEMMFQLPLNGTRSFAEVFETLDEKVVKREILTYGVSITTLEEVFLKISRGDILSPDTSESIVKCNHAMNSLQMNDTAVFSRHLQFLFKKRYQNFKRDKKAWFCSVLLPSVVSLIGFILVWVATSKQSRNMAPLRLSLADFNPKITTKRNPIIYNDPGSFMCQPGVCLLSQSTINLQNATGELYRYCGSEAKLSNEYSCSVTESSNIVASITADGAFPISLNVSSSAYPISSNESSVRKASLALPDVPAREGYSSTQYGAIFISHESSSVIAGQSPTLSYNTIVQSQCQSLSSSSNYSSDCGRFQGLSYLVDTNFTALHSSLVYQALADEAILRHSLGDDQVSIKSSIHPMPITGVESTLGLAQDSFAAWFLMIVAFPFVLGSFAEFIVQERESKAKHLQTVAGVKPWAYWLSTYIWDTINYQLPCWIIISLLFIFNIEVFTSTARNAVSATILTILIFGPAAAAFVYCFSFLFKSPSACNVVTVISGFFLGFVGALVSFILRLLGYQQALQGINDVDFFGIARIIEYCLRLHPSFCFARALLYIQNAEFFALAYNSPNLSVWSFEVMLIDFLFLLGEIFVYFGLAVYIDRKLTHPGFFKRLNFWSSPIMLASNGRDTETDHDVLTEEQRVKNGDAQNESIVIDDLVKQYGRSTLAVNHVSLGIPPGQCFGLLGTNGAGKTSTMAILTAEYPPSSGDAFICGHSVSKNPEITRRLIGYCPQFDAHFQNMTGREHVELYAAIKGVPLDSIRNAAIVKLQEVGLSDKDIDRLSATYSGGMKRKLSVACATIGNPKIVFLDEPSTGMDPGARRDMWRVISRMVSGDGQVPDSDKTSVILTTHSMEECEALCTRIAIMAGGRIRCIGSAQHLKSRFGKGWQVEVKIREVGSSDEDYTESLASLLQVKDPQRESDEEVGKKVEVYFNLEETIAALKAIEGNTQCSSTVNEDDPNGYLIWKDAKSNAGVSLSMLAHFYTQESRVSSFCSFILSQFPDTVLRERNYNRLRFEVPSQDVTIASLFRLMEANQLLLKLEDYSISQTSLEQVFNVHAAEDDKRKQERNKRLLSRS